MNEKDPSGRDPHQPGAKLDAGKSRVWLCVSGFARALGQVANVTTQGALKYTPEGWVTVPDGKARYMDAMGRHMLALGTGEKHDKDTGCHHLAQVAWNALAALELELREVEAVHKKETEALRKAVDEFLTATRSPQEFYQGAAKLGLGGALQGSSIKYQSFDPFQDQLRSRGTA